MDYTVRVVKTEDEHTFDADGKLQEKVRVTFRVGDDGPFVRRFDKATFEAYAVRAALDAFASQLRTLRGE